MLLEDRVGQPTTEAEAERLALELYGLHVAAKALPGEYDDNFHLKVKAGTSASVPAPAAVSVPSASVPSVTDIDESEAATGWSRAQTSGPDANETTDAFGRRRCRSVGCGGF